MAKYPEGLRMELIGGNKEANEAAEGVNDPKVGQGSQNGIKALYEAKKRSRVFDATMFDRLEKAEDEIMHLMGLISHAYERISQLEKAHYDRAGE